MYLFNYFDFSSYYSTTYNCPAIKVSIGKPEPFTKDPLQVKDGPGSEQLSTLVIVSIVLGILVLLLVIGGIIYFIVIRKKKAKNQVKPEEKPAVFQSAQHDLSPVASEPSLLSISLAESVSSLDSMSPSNSRLASTPKSKKSKKSKK